MKKLLLFVINLCVASLIEVDAQNLMHVAFDTNGPIGECLFPQDSIGEIVFSDIVECGYSADTIMGLAKECVYDISKKYDAKTTNVLEGITKVACDIELKVGKNYISVNAGGINIGAWERAASTVKFNIKIDIRNGKYKYTLSNFYTDRRRIPGEGKDQGPSNMIHWQRVNSLVKERERAKSSEQVRFDEMIDFEKKLYEAEYKSVLDVIKMIKSFCLINDDF